MDAKPSCGQRHLCSGQTRRLGCAEGVLLNRGRVIRMVPRGAFWQFWTGLAIGIPSAIEAGNLMTAAGVVDGCDFGPGSG